MLVLFSGGTQGCSSPPEEHPGVLETFTGAPRGAEPQRGGTQGCPPHAQEHPGVLSHSWGAPRGARVLPRGSQKHL